MSFRVSKNEHDNWQEGCAQHAPRPSDALRRVLASPAVFADFLEFGKVQRQSGVTTMSSLSLEEWTALRKFVTYYETEWESYCPPGSRPAYEREVAERERAD